MSAGTRKAQAQQPAHRAAKIIAERARRRRIGAAQRTAKDGNPVLILMFREAEA